MPNLTNPRTLFKQPCIKITPPCIVTRIPNAVFQEKVTIEDEDEENLYCDETMDEPPESPPVLRRANAIIPPCVQKPPGRPVTRLQGTSRNFAVTDFSVDLDYWEEYYENNKHSIDYMVFGEEIAPSTGQPHLQGFVCFKEKRSFDAFVKKHAPRHCSMCVKTALANERYCKKDGKFRQWGNPPSEKKQGERNDLNDIAMRILSGEITDIMQIANDNPKAIYQYGRGFEKILALRRSTQPRTEKTIVHVYWGPTGTGKSHKVFKSRAVRPEVLTLSGGKDQTFINGYTGAEEVCIEEFNDKMMSREMFLTMTDEYPMKVNTKGSCMEWNPKHIYLTSNTNPATWYGSDPAVVRRIEECVHMTFRYGQGNHGDDAAIPSVVATPGSTLCNTVNEGTVISGYREEDRVHDAAMSLLKS